MADSKRKIEISVLNGRVKLFQPEKGFRTSIDSVMLAAACPARKNDSILDMGCGVGSVGLCVFSRVRDISLTGIDVQDLSIKLAVKNAQINGFKAKFILSDIREYVVDNDDRYNHIVCNPPYMEIGKHLVSPNAHKAISNGHIDDDIEIEDWVRAALRLLKSGGCFTMIHRADMVDRIIKAMGKSFGAIEIIPLWPKMGFDAKRVIIRAIKDRKTPMKLHYGIVLHESCGKYTSKADEILRDGRGLYVED